MEQLERARQEVLNYLEENLDRLSKDQEKLVEEIIAYLSAKDYVIDRKLLKMIYEIIEENYRFIETFLKNLTVEKLPLPGEVDNNAFRQKLLDRLFNFLYPDGLNLSERLWKRKEEAKKEFFQVLKQQLHLRRSAVQTAYKIQYHMEKKLGRKFAKLTKEEIKLIEKLRQNAKAMIKGEISKKKWNSILKQYERYIEQRKETGVLHAHKTLLRELTRAVEEASTRAVDEAVHWYMYNKQLYNLKRIARTETARILNTAVVEAYKDNPFVVGFKWNLNPAHKITDICDKYASVDFGLGKGVFPADRLPMCPAHPNCMCKLTPVFK
ncbi:structural protein [Desulfurobacterium crinifex]